MESRKIAVISGGSRGIGLRFARALLNDGLKVAITAVRDKAALMKTVESLDAEFGDGRIIGIVADAASSTDAGKVSDEVLAAFG
ncbi:MAG: SDR family NAD(P)-dependent oxidoreductase, partial [Phycisphaerales bacterium]|nr:SDR family NAD(P)-dependent oxidoreductase [Phycisphaerales bacterium]